MLHCETYMPRDGGVPRAAVMLLHGYGDSGRGLIDLADPLSHFLPHAIFISPDAPHPCLMSGGGCQWFGLEDWSPQSLYDGASRAAAPLEHFIQSKLNEYNLQPAQMALLGFSQGCMMALHVGLRFTPQLAAIAGFSGALLGPETLTGEIKARPPILLTHGVMDNVVPYISMPTAAQFLRANGLDVEMETRPHLGHSIDIEGLTHAGQFLAQNLKG